MTTIRTILAAVAVLLLAGCASGGPRPDAATSRSALDRAVERWQAIIAGRPEVSWEMLTPGVRATRERETYVRDWKQKPVLYTTVSPVDEICDGDACTVSVEVEYDVRIPLAGVGSQHVAAVLEERWVRLDGVWYHLPDDFR
jgi:type IV pilus biogenesis protein CpaD/CtpE